MDFRDGGHFGPQAPGGQLHNRSDRFSLLRGGAHFRVCRAWRLYSVLGLSRFIPQMLAAGAIAIVAINYFFYRQAAKQTNGSSNVLGRKIIISTAIGLVVMAATFILLEWLNHGVVHADRFLARPEFTEALIKGVPNIDFIYVAATFFALALLWSLPFPNRLSATPRKEGQLKRAARAAVFGLRSFSLLLLYLMLRLSLGHQRVATPRPYRKFYPLAHSTESGDVRGHGEGFGADLTRPGRTVALESRASG